MVDLRLEIQSALKLSSVTGTLEAIVKVIPVRVRGPKNIYLKSKRISP